MKRVYTADSVAMAWHIRNVLEHHDIDAIVKNEGLLSLAGEVPINECQPEVWVLNDLYFKRAQEIVREIELEPVVTGEDWYCSQCGESNLASYGICWKCQTSIDGVES